MVSKKKKTDKLQSFYHGAISHRSTFVNEIFCLQNVADCFLFEYLYFHTLWSSQCEKMFLPLSETCRSLWFDRKPRLNQQASSHHHCCKTYHHKKQGVPIPHKCIYFNVWLDYDRVSKFVIIIIFKKTLNSLLWNSKNCGDTN